MDEEALSRGAALEEAAAQEDVGPDGEERLGTAAASRRDRPLGTGKAVGGGNERLLRVAAAREEGADLLPQPPSSPGPAASTIPAPSRPGRSEAPGGGA
jgi:hypothetical protein